MSRLATTGGLESDADPFAPYGNNSDSDPFAPRQADGASSDDASEEGRTGSGPVIAEGAMGEVDEEEIDSDEAFNDEDNQKYKYFKFPGSKSTDEVDRPATSPKVEIKNVNSDPTRYAMNTKTSGSDELIEVNDGVWSNTEDEEDDTESAASSRGESATRTAPISSDRAALKAILANDQAAVAADLSAAMNSDVSKGRAVKRQYQTFDRLLDIRIKLQKGLAIINGSAGETIFNADAEEEEVVKKAEEAALTLWSTIEGFRHSLLNAHTTGESAAASPKKRKRPSAINATTTSVELWDRAQELESSSLPRRRTTLDKWSDKTRGATSIAAPRSPMVDRSHQSQTKITSVLDTYIATESNKLLISSNAKATNETNHVPPVLPTYDDSNFYQSLLRDLISSRSATNPAISPDIVLPPMNRLHQPGSKNRKIDTKASKGRKVRYTVHEKLQNFTAIEGRGTWEESARKEFFGSLLGNRRALDEEHDAEDVADEMDVANREAGALKLFRN